MIEQLCGNLEMEFSEGQFPFSTDSMVLADFADYPPGSRICDLGCGSGTLALLMAAKNPSFQITGVEILPDAAESAKENVRKNRLEARVQIIHADYRDSAALPNAGFDGIICNPPYYAVCSGAAKKQPTLAAARSEENGTLAELMRVCRRILKYGGRAFFVYKPERLCDLFVCMRENALEPKRMQFVRHDEKAPVSLVLVEARRGGKAGLQVLDDCVLKNADGSYSADYLRIYHQEGK